MKAQYLDALPRIGLALDTETHLIQPGLLAPSLVVGSAAEWDGTKCNGALLEKADTARVFLAALETMVIVGANVAYDMLVLAVYLARQGVDAMPAIFKAYEEGRVYDLQIAERLHAVANGNVGDDWRTGRPLRDPETGKQAGYSLSVVTDLVLGRANAKANDAWRMRYAELDGTPIEQWPIEAKVYPVDDAVNTLEVALAQTGHLVHPGPHVWPSGGPGSDHCTTCGTDVYHAASPCRPRKDRRRNLHDLSSQCYSAWAMHLGAAWGFMVDQTAVDALEAKVMDGREERARPFFDAGIFKWKKENGVRKVARDMATIKRKVAIAYGCLGHCVFCDGTGKVPGAGKATKGCKPCDSTGLNLDSAPVPRTDGSKCKPCNATGTANGETCELCDGAGITQGVGAGRDPLQESGDELLIDLAGYLEDQKIPTVYIPWLRGVDDDGVAHPNVPLTLRPNVLLETGRTSYGGCVQLLPRKSGVRDCIVARPNRVFVSVDYDSGELITHAQSCINLVGYSKLADALNAGIKVHNAFAATVLGLSYEEFQVRFKAGDKRCKNVRQAAKPANFGFPGRLGAATLVIQQRNQGPDTPCENGPSWIESSVRGYKGLRFCILMDNATACGTVKVTEWKGRPTPPLCRHCIECAERLRAKWLEQWPENVEYFELVKRYEEYGQPITPEIAVHIGERELRPGEIVQHVSNRIRGGASGNAIANGFFQGLLADLAKRALQRVSRECYDRTLQSPLLGARVILFAHDEIIAELFEHNAHEAAYRLSAIMVEEMQRYCPDLAPACRAEPALMRRWLKGAEPVHVDGRLVPWEPK